MEWNSRERSTALPCQDVLFDARWRGPTGIGRFAEQVYRHVPGLVPFGSALSPSNPLDPLWTSCLVARRKAKAYFTPAFNAPLQCRLPLVLTVHDLNYVYFRTGSDPFRRAYFTHLVRPACRRAFRVLTVSEFSRSQIVDWAQVAPERVINVSAGVDKRFRPDGPRKDFGFPYVLAISNASAHKNTARLLRAFAESGLTSSVKLVVSGKVRADVMAALRQCRLDGMVRFVGKVSDDELPALYRGALALCMPSLFEGFGLPIVEAMACGVPVMTSTATALPETAGSAALFMEPTDVEAMSCALRRIICDQPLRSELIRLGLARSRQFSWERTAQRISSVFGELS